MSAARPDRDSPPIGSPPSRRDRRHEPSPAYTVRTLGRGRELEGTFVEFLFAFLLSIVFMYMILASNYESLIHPITILLSLPLAIPFAFLSLYLAGQSINLYSPLGILVLFGVVRRMRSCRSTT